MINFETSQRKSDWIAAAQSFCEGNYPLEILFEALFSSSKDQRKQQYAGYIMLNTHKQCPKIFVPHVDKLIKLLGAQNLHISIPRQVFSILQDIPISEKYAGIAFEEAVSVFLSKTQPIAARARALDTCSNIASQYEGLWPEVYELAQNILPEDSAGMQSVKKRISAKAQKQL